MSDRSLAKQGLDYCQRQCAAPLLRVRQSPARSRRPTRFDRTDPYASVVEPGDLGTINFVITEVERWLVRRRQGRPHTFDFLAIAPTDRTSKLAGYTRLKRSFGGQVKEYAGTWDLPIHAVKYPLYRAAETFSNTYI